MLKKSLTKLLLIAIVSVSTLVNTGIIANASTQNGWYYDSSWHYMSNGTKKTGWVNDGGTWYHINSKGDMETGWIKDGGNWYYLNPNGAMAIGWQQINNKWYYLNPNGTMKTGWITINGKSYYLNSSGDMAVNTLTPDGYWVGVDGAWYGQIFGTKIKSGNLSTGYIVEQALSDIDKFGLNTLNIPVVINIDDLSPSTMTIDKESEERAITLIKKLKGKKVNIILEAYPSIAKGDKSETEWNPNNINDFFWNWKTKILKSLIEDIAVPYNVDVLNIGSNFVKMEYAEGYWCDTIDYVRKYYKGLVTYRTNWWWKAEYDPESVRIYESKLNNMLFSKLDFISIAAYFDLMDEEVKTPEDIVDAIQSTKNKRKQNVKAEIKKLHDKWNKPIFFGELGFPKINNAAFNPCDSDENNKKGNIENNIKNNIKNNVEQANCFEGYRRSFENEEWFLGFSIFSIGENDSDKRYYPSDESTEVIKKWYSKTNN